MHKNASVCSPLFVTIICCYIIGLAIPAMAVLVLWKSTDK